MGEIIGVKFVVYVTEADTETPIDTIQHFLSKRIVIIVLMVPSWYQLLQAPTATIRVIISQEWVLRIVRIGVGVGRSGCREGHHSRRKNFIFLEVPVILRRWRV